MGKGEFWVVNSQINQDKLQQESLIGVDSYKSHAIELQQVKHNAYSEFDILGDMQYNPRAFRNRRMKLQKNGMKQSLRITIPWFFWVKLDTLCQRFEEGTKKRFNLSDLTYKLFLTFLKKYTGENYNPYNAHRDLTGVRSTPSIVATLQLEQVATTEDLEQLEELYEHSSDFISLTLSIPRYRIYECEILLRSMEESFPGHIYTVERVLETLLCDLADDIIKGDATAVIQEIYQQLIS